MDKIVIVDEKTKNAIQCGAMRQLMESLIESLVEDDIRRLHEEALSAEELLTIENSLGFVGDGTESFEDLKNRFIELVVLGKLERTILDEFQNVLDERPKYYRFTCKYEGEIEFTVKARNVAEAESFVNDLNHYDLVEYIETADTEFYSPCYNLPVQAAIRNLSGRAFCRAAEDYPDRYRRQASSTDRGQLLRSNLRAWLLLNERL